MDFESLLAHFTKRCVGKPHVVLSVKIYIFFQKNKVFICAIKNVQTLYVGILKLAIEATHSDADIYQ